MGELLRAGVDINACDEDRITALHISAQRGELAATKRLVENKANVDLKTETGVTALDAAEQRGHSEVADYLRNHGGTNGDFRTFAESEYHCPPKANRKGSE